MTMRTRFPLVPPAPVIPPAEIRNAAARLYALDFGGSLYSTPAGEPRTPVVERYENRAARLVESLTCADEQLRSARGRDQGREHG